MFDFLPDIFISFSDVEFFYYVPAAMLILAIVMLIVSFFRK